MQQHGRLQCAMQRPARLQRAALLLLFLGLCHTSQQAAAKTLPVPDPNRAGLLPVTSVTSPPVLAFDGPASAPAPVQTFMLLYDSKHAGSALLGVGTAIGAAHGTVVAQHPAIGVAFASSANGNFVTDVMAADPRLMHVASTAEVRGRGRRKPKRETHSGIGSPSGYFESSGGGGGSSASKLKDNPAQILSRKEGAGAKPGSQPREGAVAANAQRRNLAAEPVSAPMDEGVAGIILASSPNSTTGAALWGKTRVP